MYLGPSTFVSHNYQSNTVYYANRKGTSRAKHKAHAIFFYHKSLCANSILTPPIQPPSDEGYLP